MDSAIYSSHPNKSYTDKLVQAAAYKAFLETVESLQANRFPAEFGSTFFGFMDGSGNDSVSEKDTESWHTFALVVSQFDTLLSRDLSNNPVAPGSPLMKWDGTCPIKKTKPIPEIRDEYQRRFRLGLQNLHDEMVFFVHAWSYRGRDLLANFEGILARIGMRGVPGNGRRGYQIDTKQNGARRIHIRFTDPKNDISMGLGNCLVIIEAAYQLAACADFHLKNGPETAAGCLIITDPLLGDPVDPEVQKRQFGETLLMLMDGFMRGRLKLQNVKEQDTCVGELLADNFAGMLNNHLKSAESPGERIPSNLPSNVILSWGIMDGRMADGSPQYNRAKYFGYDLR
jgi:hypothetical protein